jgi:hypothetical protein
VAVVSAFLLAMCNGSPYKNDNFEWFSKKYARFIYVDRVVVSAASRGPALGVPSVRRYVSPRQIQRHPAGNLRVQYCSAQRTITIVS